MKTIILYATKHGSAKKCAEILSEKLSGKIDLFNIKEGTLPELSQYDKIIIGGSIYAGSIQKEVKEFCLKNISILKEKKLGLYICCMTKKEAEKQLNSAFTEDLLKHATIKESFGGEFRFKEMNFLGRLIIKMISKSQAKKDPSQAIDTKKDISMLSEENINRFAQAMNTIS